MIHTDAIAAGLGTSVIGKKIMHFHETDSTNTRALFLARGGAAEGTVVLADRQTAGRGRMNREWHSPGGTGIYLSIILTPRAPLNSLPGITLVAAVAAAEALESAAGVRADIKWPNDLLLNNRKICGILTELHARDDGAAIVIVGIGINVNTPAERFPAEVRDIASSLLIETGRETSREEIVISLLERFERRYEMFIFGRFDAILDRWREYSGIIGRRVCIEQDGVRTLGTVVDIDMGGALVILNISGSRQMILSGDITYI